MITESTVAGPAAPVAQSEETPFSRSVLKLEHPANVGPLMHIACWFGLLALGLLVPAATNWYLAVPLMVTLSLLNLSITIGVLHMHTHRPLFVSRRANRAIDVLCCVPAALTATEMREVHVLNHHRFDNGPGDVTSTEGRERGLRAVWYWIRYGTIVKNHTVRTVFAAHASGRTAQAAPPVRSRLDAGRGAAAGHLAGRRSHPVCALLLDPIPGDPGQLRLLRLAESRPGAYLRGRPEQIGEHRRQLCSTS